MSGNKDKAKAPLPRVKIAAEIEPLFSLYMPASLGEICQGIHNQQERLASYAINLFNQMLFYPGKLPVRSNKTSGNQQPISLEKADGSRKSPAIYYYRTLPADSNKSSATSSAGSDNYLTPRLIPVVSCMPAKLRRLFRLFCQQNQTKQLPRHLSLVHISRIPVGRGMGSSTADLALLAAGLKKLCKQGCKSGWLARLLPTIEPTDSTIFTPMTIYEQNQGSGWQSLGSLQKKARVLALGQPGSEDTVASRHARPQPPRVSSCFQLLTDAVRQNDLELLGRAATCSSRKWQDRLNYPGLAEIIEISQNCGCAGVNIAHSGNVMGIIYQQDKADIAGFMETIDRRGLSVYYPQQHKYDIIAGGIRTAKNLTE